MRPQSLSSLRSAGIPHDFLVLTQEGSATAGSLSVGDLVISRNSGIVPVQVIDHTTVDLPGYVLPRDVLERDRPNQDVVLPPDVEILVRGRRADELFGKNPVLVTPTDLKEEGIAKSVGVMEFQLVTLRFEDDQIVYTHGLELSCPAF